MKILALLGAIQGIILFLIILPSQKNKKANVNFLIGMSLAIVQILLVCYVQNPVAPGGNIYLKLITWVLPFIIPAYLYFYFRFLLGAPQTFEKNDLPYFIPGLLAILAVLPYFLNLFRSGSPWDHINLSHYTQQGLLHSFFYSALIIVFGKRMYILHYNYKLKILDLYSSFELKQLNWIQGNALGITLIGISGFISSIIGLSKFAQSNAPENIWMSDYFMLIPVSILFYWYSYKVIQSPELFRFIESPVDNSRKYSHSVIDLSYKTDLAGRLLELMNKEQIYLRPNLKLTEVADELEVSKQILSQILNEHFQQNFYDFINAYRIEVAKEKLVDPNLAHLTIQGIASESGFKSKSTFYDLFKKKTGLTPRQFQNK